VLEFDVLAGHARSPWPLVVSSAKHRRPGLLMRAHRRNRDVAVIGHCRIRELEQPDYFSETPC
jgi:hypothetical protein